MAIARLNRKSNPALWLAAALSIVVATPAFAEPRAKADPAKGQQIASTVCVGCHMADGNSVLPANPKLAGQHADYIYKQLLNFKVKPGAAEAERVNVVMAGMVGTLPTDADMRNVAAWFSAQKMQPAAAKSPDLTAAGQAIYRGGIAAKKVPACNGCHGPAGAGIPAQYPRISGQFPEYLEAQLVAFRQGARKNSEQMTTIAAALSDAEIKAVADYIAGLR